MRIAHLVVCSVALIATSWACAADAPQEVPLAPRKWGEGRGDGQHFPSRPIRLVVGTTPGSSPDLIARTVSKQAESYLGQTIVPDNRAGANGIIAAVIVAKAAPDGYTVLHTSPGFLLNAIIYRKVQYELQEFVPVTQIAAGVGYLMLVNPSLPVYTVKEFIALAKQKPLTYSSSPIGATTHLATELFNLRAGVSLRHIPYKGGADAVNAVIANETHVTFSPPTGTLGHVQSGRLRALAFSGSKRFSRLPDVPLVSEAGVPDYTVDFTWNAWFAPAKTPAAVLNRLHTAVSAALKSPRIVDFLDAAAFYPVGSTPEAFREFVDAEVKRYTRNVRETKIAPQ